MNLLDDRITGDCFGYLIILEIYWLVFMLQDLGKEMIVGTWNLASMDCSVSCQSWQFQNAWEY